MGKGNVRALWKELSEDGVSGCLLRIERQRRRRIARAHRPDDFAEDDGRTTKSFDMFMREMQAIDEVPEAAWVGPVRWIHQRPARRTLQRLRWAGQRVRRGWDDRQLWNLNDHLCRQLAGQLTALVAISHGWPDHYYETAEDWKEALELNACRLAAYARVDDCDLSVEQREQITRDAQTGLHWVADNLPILWD